jgi:hypothetical protein
MGNEKQSKATGTGSKNGLQRAAKGQQKGSKRATENSSFAKILPEYKVNIEFANLDSPYECSVISWRAVRSK